MSQDVAFEIDSWPLKQLLPQSSTGSGAPQAVLQIRHLERFLHLTVVSKFTFGEFFGFGGYMYYIYMRYWYLYNINIYNIDYIYIFIQYIIYINM